MTIFFAYNAKLAFFLMSGDFILRYGLAVYFTKDYNPRVILPISVVWWGTDFATSHQLCDSLAFSLTSLEGGLAIFLLLYTSMRATLGWSKQLTMQIVYVIGISWLLKLILWRTVSRLEEDPEDAIMREYIKDWYMGHIARWASVFRPSDRVQPTTSRLRQRNSKLRQSFKSGAAGIEDISFQVPGDSWSQDEDTDIRNLTTFFHEEIGIGLVDARFYAANLVLDGKVASSKKLEFLFEKRRLREVLFEAEMTIDDCELLEYALADHLRAKLMLPQSQLLRLTDSAAVASGHGTDGAPADTTLNELEAGLNDTTGGFKLQAQTGSSKGLSLNMSKFNKSTKARSSKSGKGQVGISASYSAVPRVPTGDMAAPQTELKDVKSSKEIESDPPVLSSEEFKKLLTKKKSKKRAEYPITSSSLDWLNSDMASTTKKWLAGFVERNKDDGIVTADGGAGKHRRRRQKSLEDLKRRIETKENTDMKVSRGKKPELPSDEVAPINPS